MLMRFRIEYAKKKDKKATIKTQKNEAVRGDATYKSSTISIATGENPNSGKYILQSITRGLCTEKLQCHRLSHLGCQRRPRLPKQLRRAWP